MNQDPAAQHSRIVGDKEIDFRALFTVLWRAKHIIGGITFAFTLIAVVVALMLPNIYRSEALLMVAESQGGVGSLASKYGGLASLAGISLPGGGDTDKKGLALKVVKSRAFINYFVSKRDLAVPIMAAKAWDSSAGRLVIDNSLYDEARGKWVRDVSPPKSIRPSQIEIYEEFIDFLSISEDGKSSFVTISIEYISPMVARQWVDWLVEDLNEVIRDDDVARAQRAIAYLSEQIESTSLTGSRAMFYQMIQQHTETAMLAKVEKEYAFRTVDPAIVPEDQIRPKRIIIVIIGMLLGGGLAVFFVLLLNVVKD